MEQIRANKTKSLIMRKWWISFYLTEKDLLNFELHYPWWISGTTMEDPVRKTICCALVAENKDNVCDFISNCFDEGTCPKVIEYRFINARPSYWVPFTERFPKADWMQWEEIVDANIKNQENNNIELKNKTIGSFLDCTVNAITKIFIKEHGFDGLYNLDGDCGCLNENLFCCSENSSGCKPGYKIECDCGEQCNFHIGPDKPGQPRACTNVECVFFCNNLAPQREKTNCKQYNFDKIKQCESYTDK